MDDAIREQLSAQLINGVWRLDEQPLKPGSSGQAWLFGARDARTNERAVVKVFKPERASDVMRETVALQKLGRQATRTAPFRDSGRLSPPLQPLPFIVMGFVDGVSLDELIGAGLLGFEERLETLAQVAEGLAELHRLRIVHRDLKPANVMVHFVDDDARSAAQALDVKLVDFGISSILEGTEDLHMTSFKGTPLYMAPEQDDGRVGLATDVYAFGLLARDLLAGNARKTRGASRDARRAIGAALASTAHPRREHIRQIFEDCLADEVSDRVASGVELAESLRSLLVQSDSPPTHPRVRLIRRWRRSAVGSGRGLDARAALNLLADWLVKFCGAVILASLPAEKRLDAVTRIAAGQSYYEVVEALRVGYVPTHPAAREALDFWLLSVTSTEPIRVLNAAALSGTLGDATILPGTLLENAIRAASSGDDAERWLCARAARDALSSSPFFSDYTLAHVTRTDQRTALVLHHGRKREHGWHGDTAALTSAHPLLVRVTLTGRMEQQVQPLRLDPFASLGGDGVDLFFLGKSSTGTPHFASPLLAETQRVPDDWLPAPPKPAANVAQRSNPAQASVTVPCAAAPITEFAGPNWLYLLTEAGEWLAIDGAGSVNPHLPRMSPCAIGAIDPQGFLLVSNYEPTLARLMPDGCEYILCDAPVLCLYPTARGVLAGDAGGKVSLVLSEESIAPLALDEPVVGLLPAGAGLALLGASGRVWLSDWPQGASSEPILLDTSAVGRCCRLFETGDPKLIGVYGAKRLALVDLDRQALHAVSTDIQGGIRDARWLPTLKNFGIVTDTGDLWTADADLRSTSRLHLPNRTDWIVGVRDLGATREVAAWTASGELFVISAQRAVRRRGNQVRLAFASGSGRGPVVVSWRAAEGAELRFEGGREAVP